MYAGRYFYCSRRRHPTSNCRQAIADGADPKDEAGCQSFNVKCHYSRLRDKGLITAKEIATRHGVTPLQTVLGPREGHLKKHRYDNISRCLFLALKHKVGIAHCLAVDQQGAMSSRLSRGRATAAFPLNSSIAGSSDLWSMNLPIRTTQKMGLDCGSRRKTLVPVACGPNLLISALPTYVQVDGRNAVSGLGC